MADAVAQRDEGSRAGTRFRPSFGGAYACVGLKVWGGRADRWTGRFGRLMTCDHATNILREGAAGWRRFSLWCCRGTMRLGVAFVVFTAMSLAVVGEAAAELNSAPGPGLFLEGTGRALAESGGALVVGGAISAIGPASNPLAGWSTATGAPASAIPAVSGAAGRVLAVVADGSGGWFIGGSFARVGGVSRDSLAHVLPDGSVDPAFDPAPSFGGTRDSEGVVSQLVLSGGTLFMSGNFDWVAGVARHGAAAVDAVTGAATAFAPDPDHWVPTGPPLTLAVADGTVFVAGSFSAMSGLPRMHLAALDSATGAPLAGFDAHLTLYEGVGGLVIVGSRLYLDVGNPNPAGGVTYTSALRALNIADGTQVAAFAPVCAYPRVLAATADVVYVADCAPSGPEGLDALRAADGAPLPGFAPVDGVTGPVALVGSQLFVSGTVNSATADNVAHYLEQVDAATGAVKRSFITDRAPDAVAAGAGELVAGGTAVLGGAVARENLAAFDVTDGTPIGAFAPQVDGVVYAVAIAAGNVYFSGAFTHVNGVPRAGLAAVRLSDGVLVASFAPANVGEVGSMVASASTLYIGGQFDQAGGQPRHNLAALNLTDGTATSFDARLPGFVVSALQLAGSTLYVGSGGSSSPGLSALDATTGATLPAFQPTLNGSSVDRLALGGNTLYIIGDFQTVDGQPRASLAAVDATDGSLRDFNAAGSLSPGGAIAATPTAVYLGAGPYNAVPRSLGEVTPTGALTAFDPQLSPTPAPAAAAVALLVGADGSLYATGDFQTSALAPTYGIAEFRPLSPPLAPPVNATPPEVQGTPVAGQTLTCTTGTWQGSPDQYTYGWLVDGRLNGSLMLYDYLTSAAHGNTFAVVDSQVGHHVSCEAIARNGGGTTSAASAAVPITTPTGTSQGPVPTPPATQTPPTTPNTAPTPSTGTHTAPPGAPARAGPPAPATPCVEPALKHRDLKVALRALARNHCGVTIRHANSIHLRGRVLRASGRPGRHYPRGHRIVIVIGT